MEILFGACICICEEGRALKSFIPHHLFLRQLQIGKQWLFFINCDSQKIIVGGLQAEDYWIQI